MNNTVQHPSRSDSTSHPDAMQLASFLEGWLESWEQARVARHLGSCPDCTRTVAEMRRLLVASDALPPVRLFHPIERFLAPLRRLAPLPVWGWHAIIHGLTPFLWLLLVDPSDLPQLGTPSWTLAMVPASVLMTTHFLWMQSWFRSFGQRLWDAGMPREKVDAFLETYLAPLQGYGFGGGWFFAGFGLLFTLSNALLFPPQRWQPGVIVAVTGLYGLTVTLAMYWGWAWSGRWWYGIAKLSRQHLPDDLLADARKQALIELLVASGTLIWQLAIDLHLQGLQTALRVYGTMMTGVLLSLWLGYALLEREVWRRSGRPQLNLAWPVLRVSGGLAMSMFPLFLVR